MAHLACHEAHSPSSALLLGSITIRIGVIVIIRNQQS